MFEFLVLFAFVSPILIYWILYIPGQRKNLDRLARNLNASRSPPEDPRLFGTVSGLHRGRKFEIYPENYGGRGAASTKVQVEIRYSGVPFNESTKALIGTLLASKKFTLPKEVSLLPNGQLEFADTALTWIYSTHLTNPEKLELALNCLAPLADLFEKTPNAYALASEEVA
jgi:hypothetical protein